MANLKVSFTIEGVSDEFLEEQNIASTEKVIIDAVNEVGDSLMAFISHLEIEEE